MPPSPQEIKARLDKVVDQEGNVLDMASVLEIVSVLERITITKEALEATRIGRVINLMRKKTENDDLAKRAKRLVKKWQKLVSNHFKNLAKSIDLSGNGNSVITTPTPPINGVVKEQEERPKSCSEISQKKGKKRRRTSISAESSPLSDKDLIKSDHPKTKTSDNGTKEAGLNWNYEIDYDLNKTVQNGQHDVLAVDVNVSEISRIDSMLLEPSRHKNTVVGKSQQFPDKEDNDQEDNWVAVPEGDTHKISSVVAGSVTGALEPPSEIPDEDLAIRRKPLPDDCIDPMAEADGINGCYDQDGAWSTWSDCVSQSRHNLSIHPYVTLE